jgi:RNA polymerase sigma factor (sigma-70 family)
MNIPAHIREGLNHRLLREDETRDLVSRARQGDEDAAAQLISCHERLVFQIAMKYAQEPSDIDELMQEGRVGILHAVTKFDISRPVRFVTYATWWIRQRIQRYGLRNGTEITMSYHDTEDRRRAISASVSLTKILMREPTVDEVCQAANVSRVIVDSLKTRFFSLDAGDYDYQLVDDCDVESDAEQHIALQQIAVLLAEMPDREREILIRYFWRGQTHKQIAHEMGIQNSARVTDIKDSALKHLRSQVLHDAQLRLI